MAIRSVIYDDATHKLVPVEPTRAMLDASIRVAERHLVGNYSNEECRTDQERADKSNRDYWQAMLSAAPAASSPEAADERAPGYVDDLELRYAEVVEERDHLRAALASAPAGAGEGASREQLLTALRLYQHAVESGMVDDDLRSAYEFARAALAGEPAVAVVKQQP